MFAEDAGTPLTVRAETFVFNPITIIVVDTDCIWIALNLHKAPFDAKRRFWQSPGALHFFQ